MPEGFRQQRIKYETFYEGIDVKMFKPFSWCTSEVFGQVWVVHETVTGKLYTLQSDRNMDVIKPMGGEIPLIPGNKMYLFIYIQEPYMQPLQRK